MGADDDLTGAGYAALLGPEWYADEEEDGWDDWDEAEIDDGPQLDLCWNCGAYGRLYDDVYICPACGEEWDAFPEPPF